LTLHKDDNSTVYKVCGPKKQWGLSPWGSEWVHFGEVTDYDLPDSIARRTCWEWETTPVQQTEAAIHTYGVDPIVDGSYGEFEDMRITYGQHWTAVVCGAESVDIELGFTYIDENDESHYIGPATFNNLSISQTTCPEYGDDHGFCD
jgi:hypothetical protein